MKEKLEAFLDTGFHYKDKTFKPLTAMGLLLLERVESPFYSGEGDGIASVLDYLYVTDSNNKTKDLVKISKNKEGWEDSVLEYADQFDAVDIKKLSLLVAESAKKLSETMVEVESVEGDTEAGK